MKSLEDISDISEDTGHLELISDNSKNTVPLGQICDIFDDTVHLHIISHISKVTVH